MDIRGMVITIATDMILLLTISSGKRQVLHLTVCPSLLTTDSPMNCNHFFFLNSARRKEAKPFQVFFGDDQVSTFTPCTQA